MLAINATELADMRSEIEQTWPDTCQVSRITSDVQSAMGGRTRTRSVVATVACRLIPNDREAPIGVEEPEDRPAGAATWTVLLPQSQDILPTDRLIINGVTYEVTADEVRRSHALANNVTVRLVE